MNMSMFSIIQHGIRKYFGAIHGYAVERDQEVVLIKSMHISRNPVCDVHVHVVHAVTHDADAQSVIAQC